jgi:CBS domain-containing protein
MKTISEVMQTHPIAIHRGESVQRALVLLIDNNISGLPVVGDDGQLLGVLSERDLLKIFSEPDSQTIDSLMTCDPVVIPVYAPLVDVVDCLMANDFRRVFIHDHEKLVGLISRSDLMPAILEALVERC